MARLSSLPQHGQYSVLGKTSGIEIKDFLSFICCKWFYYNKLTGFGRPLSAGLPFASLYSVARVSGALLRCVLLAHRS